MHDEMKTKLSRFVDDELDLEQSLSLIRSLKKDAELRQKMSRYQTISQALKSDTPVMLKSDFAERISERIKDEPTYFLPARKSQITWKKTSLAAAASLVLAAVLLPKVFNPSVPLPADPNANLAAAPQTEMTPQTGESEAPPVLVRSQVRPRATNQRLHDYLQAHSNSIYTIGASSYQPYARVAGYNQE